MHYEINEAQLLEIKNIYIKNRLFLARLGQLFAPPPHKAYSVVRTKEDGPGC
jgi:hypothetical protein